MKDILLINRGLEEAKMHGLKKVAAMVARYYLKKPGLSDFLTTRYYTVGSVFHAAVNEINFRLVRERGAFITQIQFEATNHCNLECFICQNPRQMRRPKGYLAFEVVRRALALTPRPDIALFIGLGEPLLHPELPRMLAYTASRGVTPILNTNATLLSDKKIKELIQAGTRHLYVSLQGVNSAYRRFHGYPYTKIRKRIERLLELRDSLNPRMTVAVNMVVFKENENQVEKVRSAWEGKVDHINLVPAFSCAPMPRTTPCRELWRGAVNILWDGTVTPCCVDYNAEASLGNIFRQPLAEIWNNEVYRALRRSHGRGDYPQLCRFCREFKTHYAAPRFH